MNFYVRHFAHRAKLATETTHTLKTNSEKLSQRGQKTIVRMSSLSYCKAMACARAHAASDTKVDKIIYLRASLPGRRLKCRAADCRITR